MLIKRIVVKLRAAMLLLSGGVVAAAGVPTVMATAQTRPQPTTAGITWEACPDFGVPSGQLDCGQLEVPLNYTNPNGQQMSVAVSRLKAKKPQLRRGILLLNPGGPGGPGLDMPLWMSDLMPKDVLDRYDLIGFDPRGVGYSAPVSCGLTFLQSLQIAPPLEQQKSFDATAAFMHQVADGCGAQSGSALPYITTANTARDMDRIRQAFGETKISYFGYSYGTYLGAVYASLYPNNTDRFVLDSATQPRGAWREQFRTWGQADYVRFPDFAKFLTDNEQTYHLGHNLAEVRATFFSLLHKVEENPIPLDEGFNLDGPWFRVLTFSGLYSDNNFADAAAVWTMVRDAQTGPELTARVKALSPHTNLFPEVPEDNSGASTNAVLCDDTAWSHSANQYRTELTIDRTLYPMFGELGSHIWPCAFWPNNPLAQPVNISPVGPSSKLLIIQNVRDPATPIAGATEMRTRLGGRAAMVTVMAGGHGASYGENNQCAQDTVTAYLVDGTFPGDSICPAEAPSAQKTLSSQTPQKQKAMQTLRSRMW